MAHQASYIFTIAIAVVMAFAIPASIFWPEPPPQGEEQARVWAARFGATAIECPWRTWRLYRCTALVGGRPVPLECSDDGCVVEVGR